MKLKDLRCTFDGISHNGICWLVAIAEYFNTYRDVIWKELAHYYKYSIEEPGNLAMMRDFLVTYKGLKMIEAKDFEPTDDTKYILCYGDDKNAHCVYCVGYKYHDCVTREDDFKTATWKVVFHA